MVLRPCEQTAYTLGLDGSEITPDETEFLLAMLAMLAYQKRFHRRYPTWREVLHVARCLGYRKSAEPTSVERTKLEGPDSKEDSPSAAA